MATKAAPKHVLTVVQLLPALHNGGAERSTLEVAQALVRAGHRSVVISAGGRLTSQLKTEGSRHITVAMGRKSLGTLRHISTLRRLLAELKPDIVHARSRLPAWLGWWALGGTGRSIHFVTTVHGLNTPGIYSAILLRGERVVVVSHVLRDYLLKHYPWLNLSRISVIPRGIDSVMFPYAYRPDVAWHRAFFLRYPNLTGAPLLTLPARGSRRKGHRAAIELVRALRQQGIETRLLLLGVLDSGRAAYVRTLHTLARRCGVTDCVVMTPPRDDVRNIYASSSLVLQLSSKPESFGRTVLEALALGRPVLGYAHGGVGELLSELYPEGCIEPGNHQALLERTVELLRAPVPVAPLQHYRLADMQSAVLKLYTDMVGNNLRTK